MRVQLVDPSAFTPPYDRALAAALARAGADVELLTSRFLYGPVPEADGYRVTEAFYRRSSRRGLEAPGRLFGRMDAVIAHSRHGAGRLRDVVGLDPARVRVIHHGAFDYLTRLPEERSLPPELEGA